MENAAGLYLIDNNDSYYSNNCTSTTCCINVSTELEIE